MIKHYEISFIFLLVVISFTFIDGKSAKCSKIVKKGHQKDRNTIVDTRMETLRGTWTSEGCETRPGPEYVIRHYTFLGDGRSKLIQHHYWDDSCASPKLTMILNGNLTTRRDSFLNHNALSGHLVPNKISIIPIDIKATKELNSLASYHCPERRWNSWPHLKEHTVYSNSINPNLKSHFYNLHLSEDLAQGEESIEPLPSNNSTNIKCLGSLQWAFNELKLIKVQLRPNTYLISEKAKEMHWELLLGDIPSRMEIRKGYNPTAFQAPLVKVSKGETYTYRNDKVYIKHSCQICSSILLKGERLPPHLMEKPHLPAIITGEWVSERCEIRPMGLYLFRQFTFIDKSWSGEHKFYKDPFCIIPKFTVTAIGSFLIRESSKVLKEAYNIDLKIEDASLMVFDRNMARSIDKGTCGHKKWKVKVPQKLKPTNGCLQLGIVIPFTKLDIIKLGADHLGSWVLHMGQEDTHNKKGHKRPTAFQPPLKKCTHNAGSGIHGHEKKSVGTSKKKKFLLLLALFVLVLLII